MMVGFGVGLGILWGPALARAGTGEPSALSPTSSGGTEETQTTTTTTSSPSSTTTTTTAEPATGERCRDSGVTLTFDTGSTSINGRGRSSLNGVAKWLKTDPARTVEVNAYTDNTGGAAVNQALSNGRAEAVKSYLVAQGVQADRIAAKGHGDTEKRPADLENTRAVAVTACEGSAAAAAAAPAEVPGAEAIAPAPPEPVRIYHTTTVIKTETPVQKGLPPSGIGLGLQVGGGATGFWGQGTRNFVGTGGTWEARLTVGMRQPIAFEAQYIGSAQSINALGLESNAVLIGHGAEGHLRINFTASRVQPYVFGGAGWMNYAIHNTTITSSTLERSDNAITLPFGIGVTGRIKKAFLVDVRGTGRATFDDGLLKAEAATGNVGAVRLHSWNASANVGYEF
jgi:outer membrane protein OmpA-like peptidoglycan-associated protein